MRPRQPVLDVGQVGFGWLAGTGDRGCAQVAVVGDHAGPAGLEVAGPSVGDAGLGRYPLFPNPVVAESLLDQLINTSHQVFMNGPSYRPNKRPKAQATTK